MEHGTYSSYSNRRCRCDKCSAAARQYRADMRERKRTGAGLRPTKAAILRELEDPDSPRHGAPGTYTNYGCRCEKCREFERAEHVRRASDPEWRAKQRAYRRKHKLLVAYGLTEDEYDRMLAEQDGGCAICGDPPPEDGVLCVDHCHAAGTVRKLLCNLCNVGLGSFRDDRELLLAAARYLADHQLA